MSLIRWTPNNTLANFHREFDQLFDTFFASGRGEETSLSSFVPTVDIEEKDKEFSVIVELPGLRKEDIQINIKDKMLSISGEKKQEKTEKSANYLRSERVFGKFQRSFRLMDYADEANISAEFSDGVLSVSIPKLKESIAKQLEIKVK